MLEAPIYQSRALPARKITNNLGEVSHYRGFVSAVAAIIRYWYIRVYGVHSHPIVTIIRSQTSIYVCNILLFSSILKILTAHTFAKIYTFVLLYIIMMTEWMNYAFS